MGQTIPTPDQVIHAVRCGLSDGSAVFAVIVKADGDGIPFSTRLLAPWCTAIDMLAAIEAIADALADKGEKLPGPAGRVHRSAAGLIKFDAEDARRSLVEALGGTVVGGGP